MHRNSVFAVLILCVFACICIHFHVLAFPHSHHRTFHVFLSPAIYLNCIPAATMIHIIFFSLSFSFVASSKMSAIPIIGNWPLKMFT